MKKMIVALFTGLFILCVFSSSQAQEYGYKAKIKEGLMIMAKSPQPLIESVKDEYNSAKFKPFGIFGGFLKGTFYSAKEFSTGLLRILTFNMDEDNMFVHLFKKK